MTVSQGLDRAQHPDVNDTGTVSFDGYKSCSIPSGFFTRTGSGPLVNIAQQGAGYGFISHGYISANGNVVFNAFTPSDGHAVYRTSGTGGGAVTTIALDPITASIVNATGISSNGLIVYFTDNSGSGVADVKTSDGVAVAAIPEPSGMLPLWSAGALILRSRRRQSAFFAPTGQSI